MTDMAVLAVLAVGIDDVQTVRTQGMNIPGLAAHAIPDGEKAIESLVI
jgi:hypothetical protein